MPNASAATAQLLLPGPFGHTNGNFWGIRLIAREDFDPTMLKRVLLRFGCFPPAIPKIRRLLESVGQYHCYLQYSWFSGAKERALCLQQFRDIGVVLDITERRTDRLGDEVDYTEQRPFDSPPGPVYAAPHSTYYWVRCE